MRWLAALGLLGFFAVGCGGGSDDPADKIVGDWLYVDAAGVQGLGISLKPDRTYTAIVLLLDSSTSGRGQVEKGVYTATDTTITMTPQQWTCVGPDRAETLSYTFSGVSLAITSGSKFFNLTRVPQAPDMGAMITLGCFLQDGSFVESPLAPVTN